MILTLHRRYPDGDHWEVDPEQLGAINLENGKVTVNMKDSPVKKQISRILSRPITYLGGLLDDESEDIVLKVIDKDSDEYARALKYELRRFGLEARELRKVPVGV